MQVPPPSAGNAPVSFLVDYDGTISRVDIGDALLERFYADSRELAEKDALYAAGRMGSRELLIWDMDVLPREPDLLRQAASEMPQDAGFPGFVAAVQRRGAHVEIVSDGLAFYVRPNLGSLGVPDLPIATNENRLGDGGAGMSFPFGHPTCFVCGTCKRERVRLHQATGRVVVFVGDGTSDRYAAAHADMIYAKESLAAICEAESWPYVEWERFSDVLSDVERAFADGRLPQTPDDLDRWRGLHARPPRPFICGPEVWGPGRSRPGTGPEKSAASD